MQLWIALVCLWIFENRSSAGWITRDPLYAVPLAGNKRYEQITDRLEARIRAMSPQLSTTMAQSGPK